MLLRDFCVKTWDHNKKVPIPTKQKSWLIRCRRLARLTDGTTVTGKLRRLRRSGGGRHGCAAIECALFNWYVDMRFATSTRIWPRHLRHAACVIKKKLMALCMRHAELPPKLPEVNTVKWIWCFMKKYHIIWRKSNVVYQISRPKMLRRAKRTWIQSNQVRYGIQLLCGEQRAAKRQRAEIHSHILDQKPVMENEAESSGKGTLCWEGMPSVALKSNVSASRRRVSLQTHASDDPDWDPPLEVLWKLGTDRCILALRLPNSCQMSFRNSKSGSYDEEAFLAYLERWLPKWDDDRAAKCDYRIFFLDSYVVHHMKSVLAKLWSHGFYAVRIR